jgi:hypothetical protein
VVARQAEYDATVSRAILHACVTACRACEDECARHGAQGMEHCRACADECGRCAAACERLVAAIA